MAFNTRFTYKVYPGVVFDEPSLTRSEFLRECDINNIIDNYARTGELCSPFAISRQPTFADVSEIGSYQDHLNAVIQAQSAFDSLPSKVRDRFHNDPGAFLAFVQDDSNRDEAISLGLIQAPSKASPEAAIVTPSGAEPTGEGATALIT